MMETRPKFDLPKTETERLLDGLTLAGLLIGLGALLFYYGDLPDRIPTHFDGSGNPDDYGGKAVLLFLMGLAIVMAAGLSYLTRIPHLYNYPTRVTAENAERLYGQGRLLVRLLNAGIVWIFTFITWRTIAIARGQAEGLGTWFLPVVLLVTVAVPIYMAVKMSGAKK